MAVSTNSIIHYTNNFNTLVKILEEGFKAKYCSEELYLPEDESSCEAHPIVSFCDIPLSLSFEHFEAYGHYGIGLSKKWAYKNGINPVLYIDRNSKLANSISSLITSSLNFDLPLKYDQDVTMIKAFAKNSYGHLQLKDKKIKKNKNYLFYNEREWRYLVDEQDIKSLMISVPISAYQNNKDKYNSQLEDFRLKFDAQDISYIIVRNTNEIPKLTDDIRRIFRNNCTTGQLDILLSKICSTEQIKSDY